MTMPPLSEASDHEHISLCTGQERQRLARSGNQLKRSEVADYLRRIASTIPQQLKRLEIVAEYHFQSRRRDLQRATTGGATANSKIVAPTA
jgi:hypothetical protein